MLTKRLIVSVKPEQQAFLIVAHDFCLLIRNADAIPSFVHGNSPGLQEATTNLSTAYLEALFRHSKDRFL
jgi:hypothetical protein